MTNASEWTEEIDRVSRSNHQFAHLIPPSYLGGSVECPGGPRHVRDPVGAHNVRGQRTRRGSPAPICWIAGFDHPLLLTTAPAPARLRSPVVQTFWV